MTKITKSPFYSLLTAAVVLSGCGDTGPVEVTEIRKIDLDTPLEVPKIAESDAERFRFSTKAPEAATPAAAGAPRLIWETPEGWTEAPTTQMRDVNLTFGPNGEGEVYLTRLAGAGGGLEANANRWRKQMGLPEASPEDLAKLPTKPLFNQPAVFLSLDGTFSGMGGSPKENYRMLGLILSSQGGAVFVKMTGPREVVEANSEKFDAFTASLDVSFGHEEEKEKTEEAEAPEESKEAK